jgi:DNA invertase Pin-like site-specific DNA recombinase
MIYAYTCAPEVHDASVKEHVAEYVKANNITLDTFIEDDHTSKTHWDNRDLDALIKTTMQKGDELIAYESANVARSTLQLLEVLDVMMRRGLILHLVKYKVVFTPTTMANTADFLELIQYIEGDFVARRTTDALARRRAAGLPLGRPKGRKNKNRKLDKNKAEIRKYLALNISKASIAKLLGCHAQTLYNYIDDTGITVDTSVQPESRTAAS